MKEKKKSDVSVLLDYAGSHKGLTFLGLTLSAVSWCSPWHPIFVSGWQHGI